MASYLVRETFFRPHLEFARVPSALPAEICNGLQLLLFGEGRRPVFLPIRSMQYQAIVDREEVIFVDGNGGYAHQDGEGGRLIRIAWQRARLPRDSLAAPVSYEIVYYFAGLEETQRRLVGETRTALRSMLERQRDRSLPDIDRRVLPFKRV